MDLPQLRHYTTNDFQEWDQRDVLILQPKFQRRFRMAAQGQILPDRYDSKGISHSTRLHP